MFVFQKYFRTISIFLTFSVTLIYAQPKKEHIAVMELRGEISQSESAALTNKVINEILNTGKYLVFERSQMDEILKEQGFQQTGCTSTECAIEIGQLLGVRKIVFGNIGKVGKIFSISLKMVDIQTGEIVNHVSVEFKGSLEDVLKKGIPEVVEKLIGTSALTAAERAEIKIKRKKTILTTFAISSAVVGVGSGATSIYFWSEKSSYYDKYSNSYSQDEMDEYHEKGNQAFTLAGILTGVSAAAIPTSVILFILRKKTTKQPKVSINTYISPEFSKVSFSYAF